MESKTIRINAAVTYLMFLISWLMLLQKKQDINNDFVKSHVKSAMILHILISINFIIFNFFWLFKWINIWLFSLNTILIKFIFFILFSAIFIWFYKAYNWEKFKSLDFIKFKSDKKILDINKDWNFWEKDKLTFTISYIPFLWQIIWSKYDKNEYIKEILKINTFVTFILFLLFLNNYNNLYQIILLIYFIFIAFIWVTLFGKSELFTIKLNKYFHFWELYNLIKNLFIYIKNYISWKFKTFEQIKLEQEKKFEQQNIKIIEEINNLEKINIPKYLIYIPIINLPLVLFKKNKYQLHIINWFIISLLFILSIILILFKIVSIKFIFIFLLPISYWIWNLYNIYYKMPLIYDISIFFKNFFSFFKKSKKIISEKRKEVNEVKIIVWDKK